MNRTTILLFIFAVLAVGAIVYGNYAPRSSGGSSSVQNDDLVGTVKYADGVVVIRNDEQTSWGSCWATLNADYLYPSRAPSSTFSGVPAGDELVIPALDFTTNSGNRLNVLETKPMELSLSCDDRFGYWEW